MAVEIERTAAPPAGGVETALLGRVAVAPERAAAVAALAGRAATYATRARADNTRTAYRSAWRQYERWCAALGFPTVHGEPRLVGLYLAAAADRLGVATLKVHLAAIAAAHRLTAVPLDLRHVVVAEEMAGIVRSKGVRPARIAAPLLVELLPPMVGTAETTLARRDRALLLLAFGAALRRSEAAALDLADVAISARGVKIVVRAGKGDRERAGEEVAVLRAADVRICPAAALEAWLARCGAAPGPLFQQMRKGDRIAGGRLSGRAVARAVKAAARRAGLDPAVFSGHSPRAGLPPRRRRRFRSTTSCGRRVTNRPTWHAAMSAAPTSGSAT